MCHIKTFEEFSFDKEAELNEGLFTSLKTDIKRFLEKNPEDEVKANKLLTKAFAKTFVSPATKHLKEEILSLPMEEKTRILNSCVERLNDPKIGMLKIQKDKNGVFQVGGTAIGIGSNIMGA